MPVVTAILLLLITPSWASAAIAVLNAQTFEGTTSSNNADLTFDAASDLALVFVCQRDTNASGFTGGTASVTVGGAATSALTPIQESGGVIRLAPFYKVAPATGTVNVAVTADTGADRFVAAVMTLSGTAPSGTFNTQSTASSTGSTNVDLDALASAIGELGVLGGCSSTAAPTPSPDATAPVSVEQIDVAHTNATSVRVFVYTEDGTSPSIDMRVDLSSSTRWAAAGLSIRQAQGAFRKRGAVYYP